mmetsp:Transcript_18218/g.18281  ORF Transcript_18218/g.18281 Transcript_18218/m.18281 type:complete len:161 (-) Transcript_18218:86-568(-)
MRFEMSSLERIAVRNLLNYDDDNEETDEKLVVHRKRWTLEEDRLLNLAIENHGAFSWSYLSKTYFQGSRSGPQLRARYIDIITPERERRDWTNLEDRLIVKAQQELGNQWTKIALRLNNRSGNDVKNRFRALIRYHHKKSDVKQNEIDAEFRNISFLDEE